jgi:hypothetical protein
LIVKVLGGDKTTRGGRMEEPKRVEETRGGVAMMAVEETGYGTTASKMIGLMAGKAKSGWEKVKRMMEGKRMARMEGGVRVWLSVRGIGRLRR